MKECLPADVTKDQVLYHVKRLRFSCNLLRSLDLGEFGALQFYSSGETEIKRNSKGQICVDKDHHPIEEPVALPIFGKLPSDIQCLRFAVCSAIFSDLQLLSEWGGKEDAIAMINESRTVYESKS